MHIFTNLLLGLSSLSACYGSSTTCKYPSKETITSIFTDFTDGSPEKFFAHVASNVSWTVMGTSPLAGHYTSRQSFINETILRLSKIEMPGGTISLTRVTGGCDEEWSVQELLANATMKNGLPFPNQYSWSTRWNEQTQIVEVQAYVDSELVTRAITQNEASTDSDFRTERQ